MLTDKLNQEHTQFIQSRKIAQARALIQPIRDDINRVVVELKAIRDSGVFDNADSEIKDALIAAWAVLQVAKTGFEETLVSELLDWKP